MASGILFLHVKIAMKIGNWRQETTGICSHLSYIYVKTPDNEDSEASALYIKSPDRISSVGRFRYVSIFRGRSFSPEVLVRLSSCTPGVGEVDLRCAGPVYPGCGGAL